MRQDSIIKKIAELMRRLFPEAVTLLFGSQARGTATTDSDIDLLILLPNSIQGKAFVYRRSEIVGKLYDIEMEYGVCISPIVLLKSMWKTVPHPSAST